MKKKSLLISGLIVLGAAVGITSYAVSSGAPGISLFADGDDEEIKPVTPAVFNPARGSYHLLSEDVNSAYMEFNGSVVANFSEDKVISLWLDTSSSAASYKKIAEWATTDTDAISLDGNRLNIKFDLGKDEDGNAIVLSTGTYYIDVPEGVVLVDGVPNAEYLHTDANKLWTFYISNPVNPSSVYPAQDEVIGSSLNLQTLSVTFSGLGDRGIENCIRSEDTKIVVKLGDEVFCTIPTTDTKAITLDESFVDKANIKLPEPLTKGGVYTVEIPEGLFIVKGISAAITWSFTVQAEVSAEWSMANGGTYPFSSFANFTLTYPEGTVIELNSGLHATLYNKKNGQNVEISAYTAEVNSNVVTLKANDMSKMVVANNARSNYMFIEVPAGLFTITANGSTYKNPAFNCETFLSTAFGVSDFQFIPAIDSELTTEQLKEITLLVPEGAVYCGGKTSAQTVLTVVPNNSGNNSYNYVYKFKSLSEDGRQVVAELTPAESGLSNNLEYFQKGDAYIKVTANVIQREGTTNKNSLTTIKAYNVTDGIQTAPVYESSPADGAAETSISSLTLRFPANVVVNDENAEITLSLGGKVIKSVKVSETTTAAAQAGGAGAYNVGFQNKFKDEEGNAFTDPGVYTFNVPANAFKQVGQEYLNTAYEATVYIVQNIDYEISPKPATFSGTTSALEVTPGEDFTELTSFTLTYAENATIELTENWKNALSNGKIGTVSASNLLKNPITASPSTATGYSMNNAVIDGNKVTIYLNQPYNQGTPNNYGVGILIPKGVFIVNIPGEDGTVTQYANADINAYYQGIPMAAGRLGTVSLGANGRAEAQYITPETNYIMTSELSELVYTAYQTIYPAAVTPQAELRDEDGELIAKYTGAAVDSEKLIGMSGSSIMFTPDAEYAEAVAALGTSTLTFTVLKGTLLGGSATTASLKVVNTSDFVYELNVLTSTMTPSLESGATVSQLSELEFSFSDVTLIAVDEEIVPTVTYQATYTEGIYEGDKYTVNIADEGYKVELQASGIPEEEAIAEGDDDFTSKGNIARLVITPALTREDTYSIHIPAGALLLNGVVKSSVIDMTVKVETPKAVEFEEYIIKNTPAGDEITIADTFYYSGMGSIVVTAKNGAVLNKECTGKAELQCVIPSLGIDEPMLIGTASPEEIFDMGEEQDTPGLMTLAEGEDTDYLIQFELVDDNMTMLLNQQGIWIVTIPEGMFTVNGANVTEGSFQYNLVAASKEYTWSITPEDGTEFDKEMSGNIILTVEDAEYVTYDAAPGRLTNEKGEAVTAFNSTPKYQGNQIIWSFYENNKYVWADGDYTLTIRSMTIGADMDAELTGEGNFPLEDIVVKYIVKNATGVALIGVDAADSYDVYTMDGKVVVLNGDSDALYNLASGLYIINGKKAIVRK